HCALFSAVAYGDLLRLAQALNGPVLEMIDHIDHIAGQGRFQPAHQHPGDVLARGDHNLTVDEGGCGHHAGHLSGFLHQVVVVASGTAQAGEHDMRVEAEDAITQVFFEAGHHRQDDIERHHANHHAN